MTSTSDKSSLDKVMYTSTVNLIIMIILLVGGRKYFFSNKIVVYSTKTEVKIYRDTEYLNWHIKNSETS